MNSPVNFYEKFGADDVSEANPLVAKIVVLFARGEQVTLEFINDHRTIDSALRSLRLALTNEPEHAASDARPLASGSTAAPSDAGSPPHA